jgi:hypothetical protein
MDIGKQQRVIMVEPLELTLQDQLEVLLESEEGVQPPRGGHARHQHPWQRSADPGPATGDGEDDELFPTGAA